jgi:Uma2 family endonuclease
MSTAVAPERHFTYADYLQWPHDERWELIEGIAYAMTPAPANIHQRMSVELLFQLRSWLEGKPCIVYDAPTDVRLAEPGSPDEEIDSVVQPDILVVCDRKKLDKRGVAGAPDFIIEIISPGTSSRDEIAKASLYEKYGVREYWVVYPHERLVHVRVLGEDRKFQSRHAPAKGPVAISVLEGCELNFDPIYAQLEELGLLDVN